MFPILNKKQLGKNWKQKATKNRLTNQKYWRDEEPPASIEQIYSTVESGIANLTKDLNEIVENYYFDEENLFDTLNFYSSHIHGIADFTGVGKITSLKTIMEIIKVVKLNMKYTNKKELEKIFETKEATFIEPEKSIATENSNLKLPLIESLVEDPESEAIEQPETQIKQVAEVEENEISDEEVMEVQKNKASKKREPKELPLDLQNNVDSFITPILKEAKMKNTLYVKEENIEDLEILEDLNEKINEAINERFILKMSEIDWICDICDKYFLSFLFSTVENFTSPKIKDDQYKIEKNFCFEENRIEILLNASMKYDNKRLYYKDFIKTSLADLRNLHKNFDNGVFSGISLEDLTSESKKLCNRFEMERIPILFLIFEYHLVLNKCVKALNEWLEYDMDYKDLIQEDLKVLEKRKKNMQSVRHNQKQSYNQLCYRIKLTQSFIENLKKQFKEIFEKIALKYKWNVIFDENDTFTLLPQLQYLEKKAVRDSKYVPYDCVKMLEMVSTDLDNIDKELAKFKAVMHSIKPKRELYEEKENQIQELLSNLYSIKFQLVHYFEIKKVNPNEMIILENCCLKLKEIYMYKNSNDTLRKVHYDLPLSSLKFGLSNSQYIELLKIDSEPGEINGKMPIITKHDQLNIAMHIISSYLDNDWIKFYYSLPFTPERGAENIKKDVDDAYSRYNRGEVTKERSLFCMKKWKRIHSKARLEDLKTALKNIGRFDILNDLDDKLTSFDKLVVRKDEDNRICKPNLKDNEVLTKEQIESEKKKRDAEILHQKLESFFARAKNAEATPKSYKFNAYRIK